MRNPYLSSLYALAVCLAAAGLGLFALRGEARSSRCEEYETTVLIHPNRPVRAVGRVCQVSGRWYLGSFEPGEAGR